MSGYNLILRIRKIEKLVDDLGLVMCHSKHGSFSPEYGDLVALKPKDENSLPIYSRDAEIFCGSIDQLEQWINGINWSRSYDQMLFGKNHNEKRERKEQDIRNEKLAQIIKGQRSER